jgi:hypothetical protein
VSSLFIFWIYCCVHCLEAYLSHDSRHNRRYFCFAHILIFSGLLGIKTCYSYLQKINVVFLPWAVLNASLQMWLAAFFLACCFRCFHVIVHPCPYYDDSNQVLFPYSRSSLLLSRYSEYYVVYQAFSSPTIVSYFGFGHRLKLWYISYGYPPRFTRVLWLMESLLCVKFNVLDASPHAVSLCSRVSACS